METITENKPVKLTSKEVRGTLDECNKTLFAKGLRVTFYAGFINIFYGYNKVQIPKDNLSQLVEFSCNFKGSKEEFFNQIGFIFKSKKDEVENKVI